MEIKPLDIGILQGQRYNPLQWLIMWRSLSSDTHCIIFKNHMGYIFDPTIGGIKNHHIFYYGNRKIKVIRYRDEIDTANLMEWLYMKQRTCHGYDYLSWLGYMTGIRELQNEDDWGCSELPYWMFQENGYQLTNEDVTFIFPSDLVRNPKFEIIYKGRASDLANLYS